MGPWRGAGTYGTFSSMTSPSATAATTAAAETCCRRPMSTIEVTARGATLILHSCTSCGAHVWERDGQKADRAELLEGVRTFLEQPRQPTPRRRRTPAS